MCNFKHRIYSSSQTNKIILANDYVNNENLLEKIIKNINTMHDYLCGIKINFHVLLHLNTNELITINKTAHKFNLQSIADIKLNDIFDTNKTVIKKLHDLEFDAVIVNPIIGSKNLENTINLAHDYDIGVIAICHMSYLHSSLLYDYKIVSRNKNIRMYEFFLKLSMAKNADGVIIGATFPNIIKKCKSITGNKIDVYSPGIGTQGGNASETISSGANFVIVGRTVISSKNPLYILKNLKSEIDNCFNP